MMFALHLTLLPNAIYTMYLHLLSESHMVCVCVPCSWMFMTSQMTISILFSTFLLRARSPDLSILFCFVVSFNVHFAIEHSTLLCAININEPMHVHRPTDRYFDFLFWLNHDDWCEYVLHTELLSSITYTCFWGPFSLADVHMKLTCQKWNNQTWKWNIISFCFLNATKASCWFHVFSRSLNRNLIYHLENL